MHDDFTAHTTDHADEPAQMPERPELNLPLPHFEFTSFLAEPLPPPLPAPLRQPNLGHFALMLALLVLAWSLVFLALLSIGALHLFGISNITNLMNDIRLALGLQLLVYLLTFTGCLIVMPMLWGQPYFKTLSWHAKQLWQRLPLVFSAVVLCYTLVILSSVLFSESHRKAPIEEAFQQQGAPWLLFAFGITAAPFFEEMAFRGFMLPALASAFDWSREHIYKLTPQQNEPDGTPRWSRSALIVSAVLTSIAFALIHAPQTAFSLDSLSLLFGVSMVLCYVRIFTRSLAASTLVHALYNLIIFGLMLAYTQGFQHMDKMQ